MGRKLRTRILAAVLGVSVWVFPGALGAETAEQTRLTDASLALREIMAVREKAIPGALFKNAYGIAVIPNVIKVGFIVGGRRGAGVMCIRKEDMSWSAPFFITLAGGSLGWQLGAQSADIVLVFKTRKSLDGLLKGKFTLGADAAIAAGPVGRQAEAGTDLQLKAEIYSYARSRGFFAGLSIEGSALQLDREASAAYYEDETISLEDILALNPARLPSAAASFRRLLGTYSEAADN